jgi:putative N6-adenine-specific DNA methylase
MQYFKIIIVLLALAVKTNGLLTPLPPSARFPYTTPRSILFATDGWIIEDDGYVEKPTHSQRLSIQDATQKSKRHEPNEHEKGDKISDNSEVDVRSYFATCIPGLHNTLSSELQSIGATHIECKGSSGVAFTGSPEIGLKSILWCRTAHKIMELIASSDDQDYEFDFDRGIRNSNDLYDLTRSIIHTPSLLGNGSGGLLTLSVSTIYTSKVPKELCHSHYTALTVKNALVDAVRELRQDRPDVDTEDSDVPLVVVLRGRRLHEQGRDRSREGRGRGNEREHYHSEEEELVADVDIYRCLHSGGSLHRRGYRSASNEEDDDNSTPIHRAAMKESLAAGLLLEAGWEKLITAAKIDNLGAVLIDPMTGSATLPTEAALIACDMAPGLSRIASYNGNGRNPHRYPPAVRWKDFSNESVWKELLNVATQRANAGLSWARNNVSIHCNERNQRAVSLAKSSIKNSGAGSVISLNEGDCIDWDLEDKVIPGRTIFVCNPPWGVRLTEDIDNSWVSLREFLRREASGAEAWVLSGNKDLTKILRMKTSRKVVVKTAEEDLRWLQYHIFQRKDAPILKQTT